MRWYELVTIIVVANLLVLASQFVRLERRSRELQWEKFNEAVKAIRERLDKHGWVITHVEFRPGWITGRGSVTYKRGAETFKGPVMIDGRGATREAGRMLAKGIR